MNIRKTRSGLATLLYSLILVGLVGCSSGDDETGGGPTMTVIPPLSGSGGMRLILEDGCNDGYGMEYRIFFYSTSTPNSRGTEISRLPADRNRVFVIDPSEEITNTNSCRVSSTQIARSWCFGAQTREPGDTSYWGAGINGDRSCTSCCRTCSSRGAPTTINRRLTCSNR